MSLAPDVLARLIPFVDSARALMESNPRSFEPLKQFPTGASEQACQLLGQRIAGFLPTVQSHCVGATRYSDGPSIKHTWLNVGGIIIDVTHDQFSDTGIDSGRWVFEQTSDWHRTFKLCQPHVLLDPGDWPAKLRTLYAKTIDLCM